MRNETQETLVQLLRLSDREWSRRVLHQASQRASRMRSVGARTWRNDRAAKAAVPRSTTETDTGGDHAVVMLRGSGNEPSEAFEGANRDCMGQTWANPRACRGVAEHCSDSLGINA